MKILILVLHGRCWLVGCLVRLILVTNEILNVIQICDKLVFKLMGRIGYQISDAL